MPSGPRVLHGGGHGLDLAGLHRLAVEMEDAGDAAHGVRALSAMSLANLSHGER